MAGRFLAGLGMFNSTPWMEVGQLGREGHLRITCGRRGRILAVTGVRPFAIRHVSLFPESISLETI